MEFGSSRHSSGPTAPGPRSRNRPTPGTTSLVTLALLSAGEKPDSPSVRKALEYLRNFGPDDLRSTYAISLQTQVFAAAEPERDRLLIAANVEWLERAQIQARRPGRLARDLDVFRQQVPGRR